MNKIKIGKKDEGSKILRKIVVFLVSLIFIFNTFYFPVAALPVITDNSADTAGTGDSFIVNVIVTDTKGTIENVYVEYWFDSGSKKNVSMTNSSGDYWEYNAIDIPENSIDDLSYNISAVNNSGNWSYKNNQVVDVTDIIKPNVISDSGDVIVGTGDSVVLWVEAEDNIGVTSAEVIIDEEDPIEMVYDEDSSLWEYTYAAPDDDSSHIYNLTVYDGESLSNNSGPYNITINDAIPPVISDVQASPSPTFQGGSVNLSCGVTDNIKVAAVKLIITYPNGSYINQTMYGDSDYYYEKIFYTLGTYDCFIWANDTSNNQNMSDSFNFNIIKSSYVYIDDDNIDGPWYGTLGNPYQYIQDGIDAVAENGTVYVYSGNYQENIIINKTINLIGENKDNTVIDGGKKNNFDVIYISSDKVNLSGFNIRYSGDKAGPDYFDAGIDIQSSYNNITGNRILYNRYGIITSSSTDADYNIINNNIISYNAEHGIYLLSSIFNIVTRNTISNHNKYGIYLYQSYNNNLIGNLIKSNHKGIHLAYSHYNNISGNNLSNNQGAYNNDGGVILVNSNYNLIFSNTLQGNIQYNIHLSSSKNNHLYHNNLFNYSYNAHDNDNSNTWYNEDTSTGNHWSDYDGIDENDDGIGDTPYNITGGNNEDDYPLMIPYFPLQANFSYTINDKTVSFNAALSNCEDGDIIKYEWFFGDGNSGEKIIIDHTYSIYNIYTVVLTVTDEYDRFDSISKNIIVDSESPVITDNTPTQGTTGDSFTFKAEVIDISLDGVYVEYWFGSISFGPYSMNNIGDNNYDKIIPIPYNSTQISYIISAVDDNNNWKDTGTKTITVFDNDKPQISNVQKYPKFNQEPGEKVNISCEVIDNIEVNLVMVDISSPTNFTNVSMDGSYYYNTTYTELGNYSYFIWAEDTSNNYKISSTYYFEIKENNPPVANNDSALFNTNSSDNLIDVLDNDNDIDIEDDLTIISITTPINGNATYDSDYVYYTPKIGFSGQDIFTYKISDGKDEDTATINITVIENNPPEIPKKPSPKDEAGNVDINQDLSWNKSNDPDGDPVTYEVYFGTTLPLPKVKEVSNNKHKLGTLNWDTNYFWQIIAKDDRGGKAVGPYWMFTTTYDTGGGGGDDYPIPPIPTTNKQPVADASAGEPYVGFIDEEIIFDGSLSHDQDSEGFITQWLWYFSDGTQGTGEKEGHVFSEPGTYDVILTVTDNYGAKDDYETTAEISQPNRPPSVPKINGPTKGKKNYLYNYSAASTDLDNDTIKYTFEWGDGNINESEFLPNGKPFYVNYSWNAPDSYTVKVTVTDRKSAINTEIIVNIDSHIITNVGILIDIDSDGIYDVFRNITTGKETNVFQDKFGNYLIDSDVDGDIDFAYDPLMGSKEAYKSGVSSFEIPMGIIAIIAVIAIVVVILVLFKFGFIYIEELPVNKPTKRKKEKKRNKKIKK